VTLRRSRLDDPFHSPGWQGPLPDIARLRRSLRAGLLIGAAATLVALVLRQGTWIEAAELKAFDLRTQMLAGRTQPDTSIVIVAIDEDALDAYRESLGRWPWPRDVFVYLLDYLALGGARLVVLDILFNEPDLTRPHADSAMADALAGVRAILPIAFTRGEHATAVQWEADRGRPLETPSLLRSALGAAAVDGGGLPRANAFERGGDGIAARPDGAAGEYAFVETPLELFGEQAFLLGAANFNPDRDGVSRRERLRYPFRGRLYPSLPLAAALAIDPSRFAGVGNARVGSEAGSDADQIVIRWRGTYADGRDGGYPFISAGRVLNSYEQLAAGHEPDIAPDRFRDRIVFIGLTGAGLLEARSTPLAPHDPGVFVHATVLDNLLAGDPLRRAPAWASIVLVLAAALAGGIAVATAPTAWVAAAVGALVLLIAGTVAVVAQAAGVWVDQAAPLFAALLAGVTGLTRNYLGEGRERRRVRDLFGRYVSPKIVSRLADSRESLRLGGERVPLTILFSDIRGFTTLSERLPAEQVVMVLNEYLDAMTEVVFRHDGTLDKFIGDAVMAFWGAPAAVPDHARRAADAALDMIRALEDVNARVASKTGVDARLEIGIGVHTGDAVVGNIGSLALKLDYTAIGDAVNLAARLEGMNKEYGTRILISSATADAIGGEYTTRPIGQVRIRGKEEAVTILELETSASATGQTAADPSAAAEPVPRPTVADRARGGKVLRALIGALLAGAALAGLTPTALHAQDAARGRWTEWYYQAGEWRGSQLVLRRTSNADTDSLALVARVDVYSAPSRWRAEIVRVEAGTTAEDTDVLVGDGQRVVVLTALGSTPLDEHQLADDPITRAVTANFNPQGRARQRSAGRSVTREDGQVTFVVVRDVPARGEFPDHLLVAGQASRAARGLMRLGVQRLDAGRSEAVVATAAARGATRVRTSRGEITVDPDVAGILRMDARRIDILELERFMREGRLGSHAATGQGDQ
jgi:adenylate cyclase